MIDFLLAPPNISIVIGAIVVLAIFWFIQLFINRMSNFVWFMRIGMMAIALYLLLHGVAWLISRFM